MISYRDRTFCIAQCANRGCPYKFTQDVRDAAKEWWGGDDYPVAIADRSDGCLGYTCPECLVSGGEHKMDCGRGR